MPLEEAAGRAKLATGAAAVWGAIGAAVIFAGAADPRSDARPSGVGALSLVCIAASSVGSGMRLCSLPILPKLRFRFL
jgi:hypothetical protein